MLISYSWLKTFFDGDIPTPRELAELLTFHAFEVEGVEEHGNDSVLDIDVLPNRRHDCMSHRGIAREISVLTGISLNDPFQSEFPAWSEPEALTIRIEDTGGAPRYMAAHIRGISVGESPAWLKERLAAMGQHSINNIVDATNYVMFALGQPLHAFDAAKLASKDIGYAIAVRDGKEGEKLQALDENEYDVAGDLVIADAHADIPIGIAGVKGGQQSGIDETTTEIILESANFNPARVRASAQKLGLRTDASVRFESGLAVEQAPIALAAVTDLIQELAEGELAGVVDDGKKESEARRVQLHSEKINTVLGTKLSGAEIEKILSQLNFQYGAGDEGFNVQVPFERLDIILPEDMIEEIGRIYGYENIEPAMLPETKKPPVINKEFAYVEKIREVLTGLGFSEVYTHAIVSEGMREIQNPLASDKAFLRSSLIPGIREALELNTRNMPLLGRDTISLFEIGRVFTEKREVTALALCVSGEESKRLLKGAQEQLSELGLTVTDATEDSVEIFLGEQLSALPEPLWNLPSAPTTPTSHKSVSPYPFVLRDIAVWVPSIVTSEEILGIIQTEAGELLRVSRLFDTYKKDGSTSYAFRLVFQSHEKTLSDEGIGEIMSRVEDTLNSKEGWQVR